MGRAEPGSGDTGSFPAVSADQLRLGGTVLAGLAGVGVGVTAGLAWREFERGEVEIGLAIACLALLLSGVMLFVVLQARVVAQLIDQRSSTPDYAALERRLLAAEFELAARAQDADPAGQDLPSH